MGLAPDLSGLRVRKILRSLGADHVIFEQLHDGERIHRGYVTVHIDRSGRVYLTKNRATPPDRLPVRRRHQVSAAEAVALARSALPDPRRPAALRRRESLWFPDRDRLVPAWRVRLARTGPREEWIVHVDSVTGRILSKVDNVASISGRALVFRPSPATQLDGFDALVSKRRRPLRPPESAYRAVRLGGLAGNGRLEGRRVTTRPGRGRMLRRDHDFRCLSHEPGFEEVMVYYHVDQVVRRLERLGFRGRHRIFDGPVQADARASTEDNSYYSPTDKQLLFGTGWIDDAEDGETIVHELGHAIQDAIVPDFGLSKEAAAMGEGFGDYLAASFFCAHKPQRYQTSVITWDGLLDGLEAGLDPPCQRRVDGTSTYDDFRPRGDEHDNGEIWSATLWDIRCALGAEKADRLILESHFQLDGYATFAAAARAILDADTHLERGANGSRLRRIFRRRKIGPV